MKQSLKIFFGKILTDDEIKLMNRSFDVIGDIAIIEIPPELETKKKKIGKAVLNFKHIKVVAAKAGIFEGEYRTRKLEIIAGENRKETTHTEFGCRYLLNVEEVYFSERLGNERLRIAQQVKEEEKILIMFAGAGPYPVLIARMKKIEKKNVDIYAIELNPVGYKYMVENVRLNKVNVRCILGDVKTKTPKLGMKFNRILMPLPKDAGNFLDTALNAINEGGIIHYYGFSDNKEIFAEEVKKQCENLGYDVEISDVVACGAYSPGVNRVCVDLKIKNLPRA
ncbi:MAG: class I SAM-dependent methyltransferase family protein [Candidatus Altarchaeum sp.]|nr:class I SAM-dependent methyltransferase family protein [Candidatus Altarchaeum sp.]